METELKRCSQMVNDVSKKIAKGSQSLLQLGNRSRMDRTEPEHMNELYDKCMEYLLKMLAKSNGVGSVQEDALGAVGTLIEVLGKGFEKDMPHFKPYLIVSLENHADITVCIAAVGVVTDLCRTMGKDFKNYFEEIMTKMYNALARVI